MTQMITDALLRAGIVDNVEDVAAKLENHLIPKVVEVERADGKLVLDVTSSVDAGLFCSVTTGNPQIADYTYPDGKQSGLVRFGQCERLVVDALAETLMTVVEITFTRQVSLGETVRLTIETEGLDYRSKGIITTSDITGIRMSDGKVMMKPSKVITYRPLE